MLNHIAEKHRIVKKAKQLAGLNNQKLFNIAKVQFCIAELALYCIVNNWNWHCIVVFFCIVLYCIVLYCIVKKGE